MEDSLLQSPVSQFNYPPSQPVEKSRKFLYMIIFIIFLIGGFFVAQKFFFSEKSQKKASTITPTPTEYQFPTDTPAPSASPTQGAKPTLTPAPKVNPVDAGTGLDRSTLSVEVQNGSGETGAASKGSDILKSFGYKVIATGNADNFDYQNTTIKVKSIKSNFLSLLKKDLGFSYTISSSSADLFSSSTADALVIIGK